MATSKVLSIALFVLLGLSMCSATRKLFDNRDSGDRDEDGIYGGRGFGDFGGLPGEYPGGVNSGRDGYQPGGAEIPGGGLPGTGPVEEGLEDGVLPDERGVYPDEKGYV